MYHTVSCSSDLPSGLGTFLLTEPLGIVKLATSQWAADFWDDGEVYGSYATCISGGSLVNPWRPFYMTQILGNTIGYPLLDVLTENPPRRQELRTKTIAFSYTKTYLTFYVYLLL